MKINIFILFIVCFLSLIMTTCTVNEYTALIRVDNMGANAVTNLKIGDTLIVGYLQKGAVYDYWAVSRFEGMVSLEGVDSSYSEDLYLKIEPQWEYNIYIVANEDGDDVWSVAVDKQGEGDEDQSEVKEFQ